MPLAESVTLSSSWYSAAKALGCKCWNEPSDATWDAAAVWAHNTATTSATASAHDASRGAMSKLRLGGVAGADMLRHRALSAAQAGLARPHGPPVGSVPEAYGAASDVSLTDTSDARLRIDPKQVSTVG